MIKKIQSIISGKNSYWFKSTFFSLGRQVSTILFGIGSFYFLIDVLTREQYGVWTLFLVIANILEVSRNGLIKNALIKFINDCELHEKPIIFTASFVINFCFASLSALFLFISGEFFGNWLNAPILHDLFSHYVITTFVISFFFQFEFVQQANMDFKGIFFAYFTRQGTFFFSVIYLLNNEVEIPPLHFLAYAYTSSIAVGTLVSFFFTKRFLQFSKSVDMVWVKKLLHFGKFTFATNISSVILRGTDQLMLGNLLNPEAVAPYNVAVRIANLIETPSVAVSDVVFPKSVANMKEKGTIGVRTLYEQSVGILLAILIPASILVMLIPGFILDLFSDGKYIDAVPILQVTVIYSLFLPFSRQFGNACNAINKPQWNFYLVVFSALINLGFNYFFILEYGIIGAAYGTLATYTISLFANQIILKKAIGVSLRNVFNNMKTPYLFVLNGFKKLPNG